MAVALENATCARYDRPHQEWDFSRCGKSDDALPCHDIKNTHVVSVLWHESASSFYEHSSLSQRAAHRPKETFWLAAESPGTLELRLDQKSDSPELGPAINLRACTFSGEVQELVERYPRLDLALVTWRPFSQPLEVPIID